MTASYPRKRANLTPAELARIEELMSTARQLETQLQRARNPKTADRLLWRMSDMASEAADLMYEKPKPHAG